VERQLQPSANSELKYKIKYIYKIDKSKASYEAGL